MKSLITILLSGVVMLTGSAYAESVDCSRHKIYCAIKKLQPNADSRWAMKLSNAIYKESKKVGIDPLLSVAIAMQETSLKHVNRQQNVIVADEICNEVSKPCHKVYRVVRGYSDMGLYQFHVNTISNYNIDINKLNDIDYVVKVHFKILKQKMKRCSDLGERSWVCYHSRTERLRNRYYNDVMRHYNEVKNGDHNTR